MTASPVATTSDIVTPLVSASLGVGIAAVAPFLGLEDDVTKQLLTFVAALVTAVPPVIAILRRRRRRDRVADLERLENHQLRRSVPLAMTLVVALLLIVDSLFGMVLVAWGSLPVEVQFVTQYVPLAAFMAGVFFIAAIATPYLGRHPYLMGLLAIVIMVILRVIIIRLVFRDSDLVESGLTVFQLQIATAGTHVLTLTSVLLGVWAGAGRRDLVIARKAQRLATVLAAKGELPSHQAQDATSDAAPRLTE